MEQTSQILRTAFTGTPFEGKVHLVGGCVRDRLLGLPSGSDLDLVVEGDASAAAGLLWSSGCADIPPQIFAGFGTAMVLVQGVQIELASARSESYDRSSRKPATQPASLEEDVLRRDFTVNALLQDLWTGEVRDILGSGLSDLRGRLLRTPRDPVLTFRDDPLRMLRAVRFACRLGFAMAPGLAEAVRQEAERLKIISSERIRDELNKMLLHPSGADAFQMMLDLELIPVFAPELAAMKGVEQGSYHHLDVWGHSLLVLQNAGSGDLILSWAALLHDIGKPATRTIDERGDTRFFDHAQIGARMSHDLLLRLRLSRRDAADIARLVGSHMRLGSFTVMTPSIARRLIRDLGDDVGRLFDLVEADTRSLRPGLTVMDVASMRRVVDEVLHAEAPQTWESPLTGAEIMGMFDLQPGPEVGRIKDALREAVVEGALQPGDREGAAALARSIHCTES